MHQSLTTTRMKYLVEIKFDQPIGGRYCTITDSIERADALILKIANKHAVDVCIRNSESLAIIDCFSLFK